MGVQTRGGVYGGGGWGRGGSVLKGGVGPRRGHKARGDVGESVGGHKEAYCNAGLAARDVVRQSEVARADVGAGQSRARHRRHCIGPLHVVVCQRTYCTLQYHMSTVTATVWPPHDSHLCCCSEPLQCKRQRHGSAATVAVWPAHDSCLCHCTAIIASATPYIFSYSVAKQ